MEQSWGMVVLQRIPAGWKWVQVCGSKALCLLMYMQEFWCCEFHNIDLVSCACVSAPPPLPTIWSLSGLWGKPWIPCHFVFSLSSAWWGLFTWKLHSQEGHFASRRKMASLANFNFFTYFSKILFWGTKMTLLFIFKIKTWRKICFSNYLQKHLAFLEIYSCDYMWKSLTILWIIY